MSHQYPLPDGRNAASAHALNDALRMAAFVMPRYHFHVLDDEVSVNLAIAELDGFDEILEHAHRLAAELLMADNKYSRDPEKWEISVTDRDGNEVLSFPLSAVRPGNA